MILRTIILILACLATSLPASAKLRTLGEIKTAGIIDQDRNHLVILLEGCEWDGVKSDNGGGTWRVIKKEEIPSSFEPLPGNGDPYYRLVDQTLIRVTNNGNTWRDISPWNFLRTMINDDVRMEKNRFMQAHGFWLPADEYWEVSFAVTAVILLRLVTTLVIRAHGKWILPLIISVTVYFFVFAALFACHRYCTHWMLGEQWQARYAHWDNGIAWPRWPLGIFLHLTGNTILGPLAALMTLPLTLLFAQATEATDSPWRRRARTIGYSLTFGLILLVIMVFMTGVGWDY